MRRKKAPTVDISLSAEALRLPFSEENWEATPTEVRHFIIEREKTIARLSKRVEELERRIEELLSRDSSNSDQPPSSMPLEVAHFHLYKGRCCSCGREEKGYVLSEYQVGYGLWLSALVIELAGIAGNSRRMLQGFCHSVLGLPISLGAIQKVIDRASEAILPHYEAIRDKGRSSKVNHIDETPWYNSGGLHWLWVMINPMIAFLWFMESVQKKLLSS